MQGGGEQVEHRGAVADGAVAAVHDGPPEQERREQEAEVLERRGRTRCSSVAWKSAGTCQTQRTTAWMTQATRALVISRPDRCQAGRLVARPSAAAQLTAAAPRKTTSGRPSTSSGAATSIRISCWVMCAEKSTLPHGCSGETRATKRPNQPPAKQPASHGRTPWPTPGRGATAGGGRGRRAMRRGRGAIRLPGSRPQVVPEVRASCAGRARSDRRGRPAWAAATDARATSSNSTAVRSARGRMRGGR